jgi:E3 ubiquitin-protein ligase RNF38/44
MAGRQAWDLRRSSRGGTQGMDRSVVESQPVFRFGVLCGQEGLMCAMCLGWFDRIDTRTLVKR